MCVLCCVYVCTCHVQLQSRADAFSLLCRGDEVGGSVLIEQASSGIYVELSIRLEAS